MPEGSANGLARGDVPQPSKPVTAPGRDHPPVPAERQGGDAAFVSHGLAERFARGRLPETGGPIAAPRQECLAVRASHLQEGDSRIAGPAQRLAGLRLPALAARDEGFTVGAESHRPDGTRMLD